MANSKATPGCALQAVQSPGPLGACVAQGPTKKKQGRSYKLNKVSNFMIFPKTQELTQNYRILDPQLNPKMTPGWQDMTRGCPQHRPWIAPA